MCGCVECDRRSAGLFCSALVPVGNWLKRAVELAEFLPRQTAVPGE